MRRIILSRTDSIGDVVLTLPMAGVIKQYLPGTTLLFLGRDYTRPVIEACRHVDRFISWDTILNLPPEEQTRAFRELKADAIVHVYQDKVITRLAKLAGIRLRIGTTHRLFTWFSCNRLVFFTRKNSSLHEAQLNLKLLKPLGIRVKLTREEIPAYYGLREQGAGNRAQGTGRSTLISSIQHPASSIQHPASSLILHPKSKGSAREWGLENFSRLIDLLPADRYRIFITGTREEGNQMRTFLERYQSRVTDLTGQLSLEEFIRLIAECEGLVAASTGPLHLAAALGKAAVGLYAPMRPIYPTRWAPLGPKARWLVVGKRCNDCRKSLDCHCIREITPEQVFEAIEEALLPDK